MSISIQLPIVFKDIIESDKPYYELIGGRAGGKTKNTAIIAILLQQIYINTDIVVARASYGALADSSFSEFEDVLNDLGNIKNMYELRKSPLRMERCNNTGTIYFMGYGGSNMSRTKSFHPSHKISCIILEETQELKSKENLDQAMASFRRNFGEHVKVFVLGNPPPQEAHWFNVYVNECKRKPDHCVKRITWEDIAGFLNDYDLREIITTKLTDYDYYRWFYMGDTTGGFGSVYPMFRKNKHVITPQEFSFFLETTNVRIAGMIIGGDGAVNNDATSFVPILLLTNGQSVVGPIFYHNPKEDGVIGYHNLVQDHLVRWFNEIVKQFNLGSLEDRQKSSYAVLKPIYMRIDCAAPDLIQECRFFFSNRCYVDPVKKPTVMEMVGVCQSAIMNDNVYVIDYGGYYDYHKCKFIKKEYNLLAEQINQLIWNERQDNYDPIVPNDVCDAWTYGTYSWYSNVENIQWFNILKLNRVKNQLIRDIIKEREVSYNE